MITPWIPALAGMTNQGERAFLEWLTFIANQVSNYLRN